MECCSSLFVVWILMLVASHFIEKKEERDRQVANEQAEATRLAEERAKREETHLRSKAQIVAKEPEDLSRLDDSDLRAVASYHENPRLRELAGVDAGARTSRMVRQVSAVLRGGIAFRLSGVTYEDRQRHIWRLVVGTSLIMRREPGNPHDSCAIAVDDTWGHQLGYVPRDIAAVLAPAIDAGLSCIAAVEDVKGGGKYHFGVLVTVRSAGPETHKHESAGPVALGEGSYQIPSTREGWALLNRKYEAAFTRKYITAEATHIGIRCSNVAAAAAQGHMPRSEAIRELADPDSLLLWGLLGGGEPMGQRTRRVYRSGGGEACGDWGFDDSSWDDLEYGLTPGKYQELLEDIYADDEERRDREEVEPDPWDYWFEDE